jgi:hypothetical protein
MNTAWIILSSAVGIGFGYATFGVLSLLGLGWQLWWLEPLTALVVGIFCFMLCQNIASKQNQTPITTRGERAIWRLAYRKGWELSLEQILTETMLSESAARAALGQLELNGQAVQITTNRWRLQA